ncbi:MAG: pyridoxal phosphate-dependent aminotransferase [Deltaproteobacteria bacterium]|nr:pyridoxal phosphate-dependent aminotransferase [Deltaproteobacteria bacterium]
MRSELEAAAFRTVPKTGVIFVSTEAEKKGFGKNNDEWCNLGQGQPETGPLKGGPARIHELAVGMDDFEYAPVPGLWELRDAVAQMYNRRFRKGMPSQYTAENVAISGGGRLGLARVAVALGEVNLGHFLPDYTAYEELLSVFRLFQSIPILLDEEQDYHFTSTQLRNEILGRGLSAVLLSNPCNPTGKTIAGAELAAWVAQARTLNCALICDEFYSHYIWKDPDGQPKDIVSAAEFVEDVDKDPVLLLDGLTKNWRYPGFRISWTVGPKNVIDAVSSAGSFLDGGGNRPAQMASIPLLDDENIDAETQSIHKTFSKKRTYLVDRLRELGVRIPKSPEGSFYIWGSVENLPDGMDTGMSFFRRMLDEKVVCVPGQFFDINPGRRRPGRTSRFESYLRFSFGPELEDLKEACERIETAIKKSS